MRTPRSHLLPLLAAIALACTSLVPAAAAAAPDAATQKRLDGKTTKIIGALKIEDAAKTERVKALLGEWLVTLWAWHATNDAQLKDLWTQWNQARAVVPKDEFPAEVIAYKIDDVYASLRPARDAFIAKLAAELTPEQLDTFKENWSRSPGLKRTYNAFLEIAPDLTDEHKKVIFDRLNRAREDALLTDADKEIVNIFKRHKVKAEAYVGTLEWAKLHRAFANKGK
ncbi:MAG: hypothetical protein QG602_2425 [Verrucomicrobiota bacterium]|nr:hypothetical protein [Verrucomicrobiota bacterium]